MIEIDFIAENVKLGMSGKSKECHTNAKFIAEKLKKLGYDVRVVTGIYYNPPKAIRHSWIEHEDKILETDCKQLREEGDIIPEEPFAILDKTKFGHRYKKNEQK